MADTIKQRIALDGASDIKKDLQDIGQQGEQTFSNVANAAKQADQSLQLPSLQTIESMAKRAGVSVDEMSARITAARESVNQLSTAASGLGQAGNALGGTFNGLSQLFQNLGTGVTSSVNGIQSIGQGLSALARLSGVASAITAIAAAIGEIALQGAKANEATDKLKGRLTGLAGAGAGDKLSSGLQDMSRQLGTLPEQLSPAVESLTKFGQVTDALGPSTSETLRTVRQLFERLRLGGADTEQAAKAVNDFFSEATKKGEVTGDMLRKISDVAPAAARDLSRLLTGSNVSAAELANQIDKFPISLDRFKDSLGSAATTTDAKFKDLLQHPRNLSEALEKVKLDAKQVFDALTGGPGRSSVGQALVDGISSMSEAIKQKLLGVIADAKSFASRLGAAIGELPRQFGDVARAIGNAFSAVWTAVSEGARLTWNDITRGAQAAWQGIQNLAQSVAEGLRPIWSLISQGAQGAWDAIKNGVSGLAGAISGAFSGIGDLVSRAINSEAAQRAFSAIGGAATSAWSAITNGASAVAGGLQALWNALSQGARLTWSDIAGAAQAAWQAIQNGVAGLGSALGPVWNQIADAAQRAWQSIRSGVAGLTGAISGAFSGIGDLVSSAINGDAAQSAFSAIANAATSAWSAITNGASAVAGGLASAWSTISQGAQSAWSTIATGAQSAWSMIQQGASALAGQISGAFDGIAQSIGSVFSGIVQTVLSAIEAIKSAASSVGDAVSGFAGGGGPVGGAGFAGGSNAPLSGPGTTTSDSIPAWLSVGEVVLQARAVSALVARFGSGVLGFLNNFHRLGDRPIPTFSVGGMVDHIAHRFSFDSFAFEPLRLAGGGMIAAPARTGALHPVHLHLPSGNTVSGLLAPRSVIDQLGRELALERLSASGRQPSRGRR
ncbi:phage tail protein [Bradyrhizobium elkanii]